jgi:hypothetical protein
MTADTEDRSLGRLEGRVEELAVLVHQLHADLTTGLQQVRVDLST